MGAKFDLTLGLRESAGGIRGTLNYATALFDRDTAKRYADYLRRTGCAPPEPGSLTPR